MLITDAVQVEIVGHLHPHHAFFDCVCAVLTFCINIWIWRSSLETKAAALHFDDCRCRSTLAEAAGAHTCLVPTPPLPARFAALRYLGKCFV
jgi:hypothetical protein